MACFCVCKLFKIIDIFFCISFLALVVIEENVRIHDMSLVVVNGILTEDHTITYLCLTKYTYIRKTLNTVLCLNFSSRNCSLHYVSVVSSQYNRIYLSQSSEGQFAVYSLLFWCAGTLTTNLASTKHFVLLNLNSDSLLSPMYGLVSQLVCTAFLVSSLRQS